jgi:hypothetical protein
MRSELELVAAAERGQGRRKRPTKARSTEKAPREKVLTAVNASNLKPQGRTTGAAPGRPSEAVNASACLFCKVTLPASRQRVRFCSPRHRLLFWAAGEIVRECSAGRARGLRDLIERLKLC